MFFINSIGAWETAAARAAGAGGDTTRSASAREIALIKREKSKGKNEGREAEVSVCSQQIRSSQRPSQGQQEAVSGWTVSGIPRVALSCAPVSVQIRALDPR